MFSPWEVLRSAFVAKYVRPVAIWVASVSLKVALWL